MQSAPPLPRSYWVHPGELLAGGYPGSTDPDKARHKLERLLQAGVNFFLDLTQEGELQAYAPLLPEQAAALGIDLPVRHRRMPIRDLDTPTVAEMEHILDTIDNALEAGHTVYVHCWGGIGRTGTVVGCHLVRHTLQDQSAGQRAGSLALQEIGHLRRATSVAHRNSPETDEQCEMVLHWQV